MIPTDPLFLQSATHAATRLQSSSELDVNVNVNANANANA